MMSLSPGKQRPVGQWGHARTGADYAFRVADETFIEHNEESDYRAAMAMWARGGGCVRCPRVRGVRAEAWEVRLSSAEATRRLRSGGYSALEEQLCQMLRSPMRWILSLLCRTDQLGPRLSECGRNGGRPGWRESWAVRLAWMPCRGQAEHACVCNCHTWNCMSLPDFEFWVWQIERTSDSRYIYIVLFSHSKRFTLLTWGTCLNYHQCAMYPPAVILHQKHRIIHILGISIIQLLISGEQRSISILLWVQPVIDCSLLVSTGQNFLNQCSPLSKWLCEWLF